MTGEAPDDEGDGDPEDGDPDAGGQEWPNRNALWGHVIVDELAKVGVDALALAPGSRCTPLTVAAAGHPGVAALSHLDERSASFFALGRGKRSGVPTPLVCTSGTAAANFHPAVIEADRARVPMVLLTADRPPELQDSGANQTVDQEKLYGDAVRAYRTLPEPGAEDRKLRSLRVAVARAVAVATGTPAGPVHLNVPFAKPLEPTPVPGDVPAGFEADHPLAARGREGPYVRAAPGRPETSPAERRALARALGDADRPLLVVGPDADLAPGAAVALARATGAPVFADPLSGVRFGPHVEREGALVAGGYDAYAPALPAPDLVLRFGASPTSKPLRHWLRDAAREGEARQVVVDPAGGWREATFTAADLVVADPTRLAEGLAADAGSESGDERWRERVERAERAHWDALGDAHFEGGLLHDAAALAPDPSTLFVSNSMPVRDLDRFGRPRPAAVTALGNRGASGIDGVVSSALGAGHAAGDPLVLVTGDLAFYHDLNGLLAVHRIGAPGGERPAPVGEDDPMDATVVLVNNDGGGIFHLLPIEDHDPPFTDYFRTPHGIDFSPAGALYGLDWVRADSREAFRDAYAASLEGAGTQVIEVRVDGEASHRRREALEAEVRERVREER